MTSTTNTSRSSVGRPGPTLGLGLLALAFAVPTLLYGRMPEDVPSHWNAYGEMDGTIAKPIGPFVGAMACAFVYALYLALPRLSPKGFDLDRFRGAYDAIMVCLVGAMAVVSVAVSLAAAGVAVPMAPVIGVTIGIVFAVMGNYMGKVQRNFFVGIRTPWTLANEEVWLRTHRVAGKLFVASGVVLAVSSFFGPGLVVGVAFALVASFVPVVYSYVLHRKLET